MQITGPKLRFLERKALYTFKVANTGETTATDVSLRDNLPTGFRALSADPPGHYHLPTHSVAWVLGEIPPGQNREVHLEVQAIQTGELKHQAAVQAAYGLRAEGEFLTRVEGSSALQLQVLDRDDPIEVNGETAYEIHVNNTGSKLETDVKLVCTIPDQMEFKSATGPSHYHVEGKTIVFEPVARLEVKADVVYGLTVKAVKPGSARFSVKLNSTDLGEPVMMTKATRIYADDSQPENPKH